MLINEVVNGGHYPFCSDESCMCSQEKEFVHFIFRGFKKRAWKHIELLNGN